MTLDATPADTAINAEERTVHRICPLCEACCGLELKVRGRQVVSVRGHEADVFSAGYLCPKGVALKELHDDPDRLRMPLVRRDGKWVEVGWDEALAEVERRLTPLLTQHGRSALAVVTGNPNVHKLGLGTYLARFIRAAGTPNFFSASTLDQMPKQLSSGLMFGHWLSVAVPDIERCNHLLMLGANPAVSNGSLWTVPDFRGKARALRQRGGRLVVIDPRRTETADLADQHHFIRPGTDVFLLLGMVHTLFDEGRLRLRHLADQVNGLDELAAAVRPFAPEQMAGHCGIAAQTIRTLARELAAAERGAIYGRLGTCTQAFGTLCSWLIDVLNVLCGHLDAPGGVMFPKAAAFQANTMGPPGRGRGITVGRHRSRVSGAPEVFGELPAGCLAEEIETPGAGQVKALITVAANPVLSAPNGPRLAQALGQLDFMLCVDIYLNETTRHADVILPGLSPLEESHYDPAFSQLSHHNQARFSEAVFAPPAGQPAEWEILLTLIAILQGRGAHTDRQALDDELLKAELARTAGPQADALFEAVSTWRGPERLLDLGLRTGPYGQGPDGLTLARLRQARDGIDLGPLAPRIPEVLRTPSGRIELAPPLLMADLQRVPAQLEQAPPPLVIVGRRQVRSNNSWLHNLPLLAKGPYRCTLLVHPDDAARQGLQHEGLAEIEGPGGRRVQAVVELSAEMMPGVVSLPHGWGHDLPGSALRVAADRPGANLNAVLDEQARDPLSGNAVLSGVPVSLRPVVDTH